MEIIRVVRKGCYTAMNNTHLRDKNLSCKACGLLCKILALPNDWNLTVSGLSSIVPEGKSAVYGIIKELIDNNYIVRRRERKEDGTMGAVVYTIYEGKAPLPKNPDMDNPHMDNPRVENRPQLNTNIIKDEYNKKENSIKESQPEISKRFKVPSLEEVKAYCKERGNRVDAERFMDYYESNGWKVGRNPMKDWKASIRTWERSSYSNNSNSQGYAPRSRVDSITSYHEPGKADGLNW